MSDRRGDCWIPACAGMTEGDGAGMSSVFGAVAQPAIARRNRGGLRALATFEIVMSPRRIVRTRDGIVDPVADR